MGIAHPPPKRTWGVRFTLDLPWSNETLDYGFDASAIDWFGEIRDEHDCIVFEYNGLHPEYDRTRPLGGLLRWIGSVTDLYDEDALHDTLELLLCLDVTDLPDELRYVGEIVQNLKSAADYA